MHRRKLMVGCVSLASLGAFAATSLLRPAAARAEEAAFEPLPAELGTVPRTASSVDDGVELATYDRGGFHAEIKVRPHLAWRSTSTYGVDFSATAYALLGLHPAMLTILRNPGIESTNRRYELGDVLRWEYVGNIYGFRAADGTPIRRLVLVTTHDHRLVTIIVDLAGDGGTQVQPFLEALSAFFQRTLPNR